MNSGIMTSELPSREKFGPEILRRETGGRELVVDLVPATEAHEITEWKEREIARLRVAGLIDQERTDVHAAIGRQLLAEVTASLATLDRACTSVLTELDGDSWLVDDAGYLWCDPATWHPDETSSW
jgi:hypothetical protein